MIKDLPDPLYKLYLHLVKNYLFLKFHDKIEKGAKNEAIELCVAAARKEKDCTSLAQKIFDFYFHE